MDFLGEMHRTLSTMMLLYSFIAGVWGLFNFLRRRPPDGNYNGALAVGVILFVLQGLVGLILLLGGRSTERTLPLLYGLPVHMLYGVTAMLTIPAIFAFTRGRNSVRESLLYGLGMLFIWGLSLRAVETGAPAGG